MVKGAWIINLHTLKCKNWVNGIEVVFQLDGNGRPAGTHMSLPAAWPGELYEKSRGTQEGMVFLCRMWQRAILVFSRAWYRHLFRRQCREEQAVKETGNRKASPRSPRSAPPVPAR